jgi:putative component of membrane protein insertase Oxa1/YidC/SpoIIIJ protein YidD
MKSISLKMIAWYQKSGGGQKLFNISCNYTPSCSEYTRQALLKYGFLKGWRLGLARIRRCKNPDTHKVIEDKLT